MTAPAPPRGTRTEARKLLDVDEWVFFTRVIGLTPAQARERLGYSERRTARYEELLADRPELSAYWRELSAG
jgi:hypothetical protein